MEQDGPEEGEEQEGEDNEPPSAEPAVPGLLDLVTPTRITATGRIEEDMSSGEFVNIVTSQLVLEFWNVGSMVPGYGGATLQWTATGSFNGVSDTDTCSGTFSGGPNGSFTIHCKGGSRTFRLKDGQTVAFGSVVLRIQNSGAFAGWPKGK
jgi:hypothetical protein